MTGRKFFQTLPNDHDQAEAASKPLRTSQVLRIGPKATGHPRFLASHFRAAWRDIDAALAAVPEIRFEPRQSGI